MEGERTETYKNYQIACSANHETAGFLASAMISWTSRQGTFITYFLRSPKIHITQDGAVAATLQVAKAWIDLQPPL